MEWTMEQPISNAHAAVPRPTPPQVKVMRLALTRAGPMNAAASARGSLLTLPTVFETIHAGQQLKCLARVLYAPRGCKVSARLEYGRGQNSVEVGSASGEGAVDLLVKARLTTSGPHELILSCVTKQGGEALRKVYKIDVNQSFVLEGPPRIAQLQAKTCLRFQVRNSSKEMIARINRIEFMPEQGIVVLPPFSYTFEPGERNNAACFMGPGESQSFVFFLRPDASLPNGKILGRVRISWNSGLGEECELFLPELRFDEALMRPTSHHFDVKDPASKSTKWSVGKPVAIRLDSMEGARNYAPFEFESSFVRSGTFAIHGPRVLPNGGETFIIPTRPGVFEDVSSIFGLNERFSAFVVGNSRETTLSPTAPQLDFSFQSPRSLSLYPQSPIVTEEAVDDVAMDAYNSLQPPEDLIQERAQEATATHPPVRSLSDELAAEFESDAELPSGPSISDEQPRERSLSAELRQEFGSDLGDSAVMDSALLETESFAMEYGDEPSTTEVKVATSSYDEHDENRTD